MAEALRVGMLGAGIFAMEGQGPAWKRLVERGKVHVVVCWSRTEQSAQRLADFYGGTPEVKFGEDGVVKEVLAREDVDAVSVATTITSLPKFARMAIDAGKHVLTEKPVAGNITDGSSLVEWYEALRVEGPAPLYGVAENYRFEQVFVESLNRIGPGNSIGKPLVIELTAHMPFAKDSKYEQTWWRRESSHIGGVITDGGVHFMAAMRMLAGCEVASCAAFADKKSEHLPKVDTVVASFKFDSGALGSVVICYAASSRRFEMRVRGETGSLEIGRSEQDGKHGYTLRTITSGKDDDLQFYPFCGVEREIEVFVDACRGKGDLREALKMRPRESLRDLGLIDAMLRSSESGKLVTPFG